MHCVACSRCKAYPNRPITCNVLDGGSCSACKDRATIRQKIEQLEAEIEELKTRYHTLAPEMNANHDPFIHKLPPEISSHIFRLSLSPPYSCLSPSPSLEDRLAARLKLGHVCRMWRQLAWTTPDLWENVYLAIGPETSHSLAKFLPDLLQEWLDRSGVLPLTISFVHDGWPHPTNYSGEPLSEDKFSDRQVFRLNTSKVATRLAIKALNSCSGRWQNLNIEAVADIFEHFSGDIQPNQLVNLHLNARSDDSQPLPNFMMESELIPTQLVLIDFPLTSVNVCWDGITHLTLRNTGIYSDDFIDVLQRAPRLEYYNISIPQQPEVTFSKHILHPRLRSLKLDDWIQDFLKPSCMEGFLEAVTLPSLEEWTQRLNGIRLPLTILSLLERSGCHLKVLHLKHIPNDPEGLNTLLQAIPSLEHIKLSFAEYGFDVRPIMDDFLTRIFNPAEDPALDSFLPRLRSIHYISRVTHTQEVGEFPWDRIPQLYRQTCRQSLALKSSADFPRISDETARQLLLLIDEGVDLQIIDPIYGGNILEGFVSGRGEIDLTRILRSAF